MESITKNHMLSFLNANNLLSTNDTTYFRQSYHNYKTHHFSKFTPFRSAIKPNCQYTLVYNNHNLGKISRLVSTPGVRCSRNLPVFAQVSTVSCADSRS